MTKFIIKHGILWLMICNFQINLSAQDFNETISFADKQFEIKNYQLAVKEYQRALFYAKGRRIDYLYKQIANAFFANSQLEQANYFYDLSYRTAETDSLKYEILFNKAQCYILSKKYNQAIAELLNLQDETDKYFNDKKNFYLAISYFGLAKFIDSEKHFLKLLDKNDTQNKDKITNLFAKKKNLNKPNPKTARILSRIIPGAGQVYAGDIKNGLNSLLLTGSFVALGVYMADRYTYLDAILTSLPWFLRYYKGGHHKAFEIAENKRAKRRSKTYLKIIETIKESKTDNKK